MLRDKDIAGVLEALAPRVDRWHVASLGGPRGASSADLASALGNTSNVHRHETIAQAIAAARTSAREDDKIVVFGSFLTVGEAIAWLNNNKTSIR
jgi:dihydrofolate synthase/folylpolyglutamate synthase